MGHIYIRKPPLGKLPYMIIFAFGHGTNLERREDVLLLAVIGHE